MARGFTCQTVLFAALLAAMACSHRALADEDDGFDDTPVATHGYKLKQPVRYSSARTNRQAMFQQSDDDQMPAPARPRNAAPQPQPEPWDDDGSAGPMNASGGPDMPCCDQCGGCQGCCKCCLCGPPGQFWVRDEYIGFWTKGDNLPVLVTTTPTGTLPATTPVFGGNNVNTGFRSGNWITGGMWLDCCQTWGIQGNYFFLGQQSTNFNSASDGDPVLGRPFTDATNGAASQQLISFPGTVVGSVSINDTNSFQGAGVQLSHNLCCMTCCDDPCGNSCGGSYGNSYGNDGCGQCGYRGQNCCRIDALVGFQYYNLNNNLNITENLTSTSTTSGVPVGTMIQVNDSFRTQNNFYGGTLGLVLNRYRGRWVHQLQGLISLGTNNERISINGNTTVSFPGSPTSVSQGGLYALQSNIGNYTHNNFAAIPQISARLGYRVTERFTAFVGYTFIYWGQVATAGNQIDTTVNPNLIPPVQAPLTPARPAFTLHESSFWAQGITLGGQFNF